ncbi:MAG: hypothetical protein Q7T25_11945 [Sideroxyarcus sp.]|nr:hypothetical protein [Sideroxyarcus sp.]
MTAENEKDNLKSDIDEEGQDKDKDQDFLICSFTQYGKVIIPGRDED